MKIVYEILHYKAINVTSECVSNLLATKSETSEIVIVDNASPDDSWDQLRNMYSSNTQIHLIRSTCNLGFAKGNNLGYSYAKKSLNADIIICMNNDIMIKQKDFEQNLNQLIIEQNDLAVISPATINLEGRNQNPLRLKRLSSPYIFKSLIKHLLYLFVLLLNLKFEFFYNKYHSFEKILKNGEENDIIYNIVPHGACVIFTPKFVNTSDYAFVPITFFYGEEDLLYDYICKMKLHNCYSPNLMVEHWEKSSTKSFSQDLRALEIFRIKSRTSSKFQILKYRVLNSLL